MITKHVDILDRFNRAMPLIGIPFFIYQAKKHLEMAKEDDDIFVREMRELGKEPEERLKTHGVKQEWFLIKSLAITLVTVWAIATAVLTNFLAIEFVFVVSTILAMSADFAVGEISLKAFTQKEERTAG